MDGSEAVDGSKMGGKFIFFAAILVLALAAFLIGKNLVNTGVDNMEKSVAAINDSRYSDYNKTVVKGRAVKAALDSFDGEEIAIVICTLNMADKGFDFTKLTNYSGGSAIVTIENATMKKSDGNSTTGSNVKGINYNAIIGKDLATGNDPSKVTENKIKMDNGDALYEGDFAHDASGNILYYNETANLNKKGSGEYVADSSSFNANLIKNSSGEICGILFVQKKLS